VSQSKDSLISEGRRKEKKKTKQERNQQVMQRQSLTTSHQQTTKAQPVSEQWLLGKYSLPCMHPVLLLGMMSYSMGDPFGQLG